MATVALSGTNNKTASMDFGNATLSGYCVLHYRPALACHVESFTMDRNEYGAVTAGILNLATGF